MSGMTAEWALYRESSVVDFQYAKTTAAAKAQARSRLRSLSAVYWVQIWPPDGGIKLISSRDRAGAISFKPSRF
jgi:hypothetical protein